MDLPAASRRWLTPAIVGTVLQTIEMAMHTIAYVDAENLVAGLPTPVLTTHLWMTVLFYPVFGVTMVGFLVAASRELAPGEPDILVDDMQLRPEEVEQLRRLLRHDVDVRPHLQTRILDAGHQPLGVVHQPAGHLAPFARGGFPERGVAVEELAPGLPEPGLQLLQTAGHLDQPRVGQEVPDPAQEREGVGLDQRVGAALYQGQRGGALLGQEPLVAERDQPVGDVAGVQAEEVWQAEHWPG